MMTALLSAQTAAAQVTTAQYGNARTGAATNETTLTPQNVRSATFGKIGTFEVDGDVYAQPLYVPRLEIANRGTHDVLFVATEHGSVYAFDATNSRLPPLWEISFIDPALDITPVPFRDASCPFIRPEIGITPTPVIDLESGIMYVLMRTKEPTARGDHRYVQRLHAINIHTGTDRLPPVEIRASVRGTGAGSKMGVIEFEPLRENPRAALLLNRGVVYLSWASGDAGLAADSAGNVFAVTGNGTFSETGPSFDYGNTVLKLSLTPSGLIVRDYFTPSNEKQLSIADLDLGSSGPLLIDEQRGPHRHMLLVTGKAGVSYLIDRDKMGHYQPGDDPHVITTVRTSESGFGAPAYWNHNLYIWGSNDVLKSYRVNAGGLSTPVLSSAKSADPGAPAVVSANGDTNGVVWAIETRTWRGADKPAVLHAFDASDVRKEIYNSEMIPGRDRAGIALRFAMPTVAAGRVYVGVKSAVDMYGLIGAGHR